MKIPITELTVRGVRKAKISAGDRCNEFNHLHCSIDQYLKIINALQEELGEHYLLPIPSSISIGPPVPTEFLRPFLGIDFVSLDSETAYFEGPEESGIRFERCEIDA